MKNCAVEDSWSFFHPFTHQASVKIDLPTFLYLSTVKLLSRSASRPKSKFFSWKSHQIFQLSGCKSKTFQGKITCCSVHFTLCKSYVPTQVVPSILLFLACAVIDVKSIMEKACSKPFLGANHLYCSLSILMDKGISPEVVRSILAQRANWPCLAAKSAYKMETLSRGEYLSKVVEAYSRPTRIVRGKDISADVEVDETAFETNEERALWNTYLSLRNKIHPGMEVDDFVKTSAELLQPLEDFFNNVFVMVEDERIRKNRLSLLQKIADLPKGIADLSVLPGF